MIEVLAGIGLGCIMTWAFAVRPLVRTIRDMRYQGFVHDQPPPPKLKGPGPIMRNES